MSSPVLVDTSAWVEYLRATGSKQDIALGRALQSPHGVLMPAVVLQELLQGARSPQHCMALQSALETVDLFEPQDWGHLHAQAGLLYARCRWQGLTVRNPKGQQLLDLVEAELDVAPVTSSGNRQAAVQQGIEAYDKAVKLPLWLAQLIGLVVERFGPKGLEYGRFSIDSHFTRNALWLRRNHPEKLEAHIPAFAKAIISRYRLPAS